LLQEKICQHVLSLGDMRLLLLLSFICLQQKILHSGVWYTYLTSCHFLTVELYFYCPGRLLLLVDTHHLAHSTWAIAISIAISPASVEVICVEFLFAWRPVWSTFPNTHKYACVTFHVWMYNIWAVNPPLWIVVWLNCQWYVLCVPYLMYITYCITLDSFL